MFSTIKKHNFHITNMSPSIITLYEYVYTRFLILTQEYYKKTTGKTNMERTPYKPAMLYVLQCSIIFNVIIFKIYIS